MKYIKTNNNNNNNHNHIISSIRTRWSVRLLTVITLLLFGIVQWVAFRDTASEKINEDAIMVIASATDDGSARGSGSSGSTTRVPECLYGSGNNVSSNGPTNVILMSLGRSGSTVIWKMLSKLTGYETHSVEYVGSDSAHTIKFFNRTVREKKELSDGKWLTKIMCLLQTKDELRNAAFVGFKWKSLWDPFLLPESQKSFELIASMATTTTATTTTTTTTRQPQFPGPPIRVLRLRRNALDVGLSRLKHKERHVDAHCRSTLAPKKLKKCLATHDLGARRRNAKKLYHTTLDLWERPHRAYFL